MRLSVQIRLFPQPRFVSFRFMLILVLVFPLLGFLSGGLFGRFMGLGISYITTLFTFFSFLISFGLLYNIITTGNVYILKLTE